MKYQITVEKISQHSYKASCPTIMDLEATGPSANAALSNLHKNLICYLHDPDAELEIQLKDIEGNLHAQPMEFENGELK